MSLSSFDSEDFDPCELESNLSLPMSATSSPNEAGSFVPLEASQIVQKDLTALESLVPLIDELPGLILENQVYYASQPLSKTERDALLSKASSIVDLTLTEQSGGGKLSAGVFMTLAKAQPYDESLFPSLKYLRLKDAGSYMNYLDLFLGPSLEGLEISAVPDIHEESLLSFLKAAAVQLPRLKSLVLKDGNISLTSLSTYLQLKSLQSLALFNCPSTFDLSFFKAIGSLPSLEEFVFKPTQEYSYSSEFLAEGLNELVELSVARLRVDDEINSLEVQVEELRERKPNFQRKEETFVARFTEVTSVLEELHLGSCRLSSMASAYEYQPYLRKTMQQQQELYGIPSDRFDAAMDLISELGLERRKIKAKSKLLLRRVIRDKLRAYIEANNPVSDEHDTLARLEKLETTLEMLGQQRDSIIAKSAALGVDGVNANGVGNSLSTSTTSQHQHEPDAQGQRIAPLFSHLRVLEASGSMGLIVDLISATQAPAIQRLSLTVNTPLSDTPDVREVELGGLNNILQKLERWHETFKSVSLAVSGLQVPPPSISSSLFSKLLHSPQIERIDLSGFEIEDIHTSFDGLNTAVSHSKLQHLHIPFQPNRPGISLSRLRQIAEACPDLVSLQCRFENIADVKQHTLGEAAPNPMSHKLRVLNVGNIGQQLDPGILLHVARYLDVLFPHLESIKPLESASQNMSQWSFVGDMVKAFHSARLDDVARAKMRSADGA
ncbi:hypothetical protein CPB83DRAFT_904788 [Crepidotus variabilis]|uniref:Uncharacterized protein n=1 Tax=Crepidotus variabilis TaxID=179855 RepID=A0A9P6ELV0_9AGAR|nr:hypothetical protein CPB83DRAFT_904788 [Crepidotus variabilis]